MGLLTFWLRRDEKLRSVSLEGIAQAHCGYISLLNVLQLATAEHFYL